MPSPVSPSTYHFLFASASIRTLLVLIVSVGCARWMAGGSSIGTLDFAAISSTRHGNSRRRFIGSACRRFREGRPRAVGEIREHAVDAELAEAREIVRLVHGVGVDAHATPV